MALPGARAAEREDDELPRLETESFSSGSSDSSTSCRLAAVPRRFGVVVDRETLPPANFPVQARGDADPTDDQVDDAQECGVVQNLVHNGAMRHRCG